MEIGENVQGWVFWTWKVCAVVLFLSISFHNYPHRQRMPMNGVTRRVWKGAGYHRTLRIDGTQGFALK